MKSQSFLSLHNSVLLSFQALYRSPKTSQLVILISVSPFLQLSFSSLSLMDKHNSSIHIYEGLWEKAIDSFCVSLVVQLKPVGRNSDSASIMSLSSETFSGPPLWAESKFSILVLKIFHHRILSLIFPCSWSGSVNTSVVIILRI